MGVLGVVGVACVGVWVFASSACFFRGAARLAAFVLVTHFVTVQVDAAGYPGGSVSSYCLVGWGAAVWGGRYAARSAVSVGELGGRYTCLYYRHSLCGKARVLQEQSRARQVAPRETTRGTAHPRRTYQKVRGCKCGLRGRSLCSDHEGCEGSGVDGSEAIGMYDMNDRAVR